VAEAGYVGIAPDLLSGMGPNGGGSSSFDANGVRQAVGSLPPDQITADLNAVADYVAKLPAANGKVAVGGFCWGGSQTFRFATNRPSLKAAFAFYGSAPANGQAVDKEALGRIGAPVYGFYAENDARIDAHHSRDHGRDERSWEEIRAVTYAGAGHGFMRAGEAPSLSLLRPRAIRTPSEKAAADYQKAVTAYKANKKRAKTPGNAEEDIGGNIDGKAVNRKSYIVNRDP
jgi:carboxymethylenebutenolidase